MSRTNVTEPTKPWTWYTGNSVLKEYFANLTYPSGYISWKSMPSYTIIDTLGYEVVSPFGTLVKPDSIIAGGTGSGAAVELQGAVVGDAFSINSYPYYMLWTSDSLAGGVKINKAIWKSLGRGYTSPVLKLSGTSVNYRIKGGDPLEDEYEVVLGGSEYYARDTATTIHYGLTTITIESQYNYYLTYFPGEVNTKMKEWVQTQFNGADYRWGTWTDSVQGRSQGQKLTAQLPSFPGAITNNTPANATKASWWSDFKTKFWEAIFAGPASYGDIYFVLMYGPNGAKAALDAGQITPEQFNLLKGYYGSQFLTGTVFGSTTLLNTLTTNGTPLAGLSLPLQATVKNLEIVISTILNAGHQLGQAWKNYVTSRQGELVPSIELYDVTPSKQDYTGAFTAQSKISTAKNLLDYIYDEMDDFKQQTLGSMKTTASKPDFAGFSVKNRTFTTRNPLNGNTITFTFDSNGDWTKTESQ